jgi:putative ABC transport system substrate-binding protein
MKRREFLGALTLSAALWPCKALAQVLPKRALIGFLGSSSEKAGARYFSGFPLGMRELGYVSGRDYVSENRYANDDLTRLPSLAEELVRLRPDVIVTGTTPAALAAKKATASVPIVGINMTDPVGFGLVTSEAHPGTNVTGILFRLEGLTGKQLEIALDLMPKASTIGLMVNVNNPSNVLQRRETEVAAAKLGVVLIPLEIRAGADIGPAFQRLVRERASGAFIVGDPLFLGVRRQIAAYALASRLPTMFVFREHTEDGGLISYGIDLHANFRRAAYFVDRILKGQKPADLPVEFPTKLELVINLATAKALGLDVPATLLARADEVIE